MCFGGTACLFKRLRKYAVCGEHDGSRPTLAPNYPNIPSGGTCRSSVVTCACVASVRAGKKQDKQSVGYEGRSRRSHVCCCAWTGDRARSCRAMRIEMFSVYVGGRGQESKFQSSVSFCFRIFLCLLVAITCQNGQSKFKSNLLPK